MSQKRFLLCVIDDGRVIDGPEVMPAIDAFNEKLRSNGHWIFAWGLFGPTRSKVIDNREHLGSVVPGPLVSYREGDEYVSGIWIIQAEDEDEAEVVAREASLACNRKIELRPFH